jgi:hypothetical protein
VNRQPGTCAASSPVTGPALPGFSVEVRCNQTAHIEGSALTGAINTYRLQAIVSIGASGSLDYVLCRLQATLSLDPP